MRYSIIGDIIAEEHDGDITPGGAASIARALNDLGGRVTLRSVVSTDDVGQRVLAMIKKARIHPGQIDRVDDGALARVERHDDGSVIDRTPGIGIARGAVMDIYDLFGHDALVLDTRDQPLRRFVTDLPAHTDGNVKMVGSLRHLEWQEATADEMEIALRFDAIVGTPVHYERLTGRPVASDALGEIFDRMPGAHLRAAIAITPDGLELVGREERVLRPVRDAVPDLMLPQVVAGVAWGMAHRADWEHTATVAVDPSAADR